MGKLFVESLEKYSQHLKSGPSGFIGFNSCPIVEWSGFRMVASLDRFIKKRVMKKIITKWSRLEVKKTLVRFLNAKWPPKHSKTGLKNCPKNDHSKSGWSGFLMFTVLLFSLHIMLKFQDKALLFLVRTLHPIVSNGPYVVVYFHTK